MNLAAVVSIVAVSLSFFQAYQARTERVRAEEAMTAAQSAVTKAERARDESREVATSFIVWQGKLLLLSIAHADGWGTYLDERKRYNECLEENPDCDDRSVGKAGLPFQSKAEDYQRIVDERNDRSELRMEVCTQLRKSYDRPSDQVFEILFLDWCNSRT